MNETSARAAASSSSRLREGMWLGEARELDDGWYFPFQSRAAMAGCNGVIVNKRSGALFHLGSAFPPERDLRLYARGYQFECYDLTIVSVRDRAQALNVLAALRMNVVEPKEEDGVVWKIPRELTKAELAQMIDRLPCVMPGVKLYFVADALENARIAGWLTCEIREHVRPTLTNPPGAS